jgi:hypothetical protein
VRQHRFGSTPRASRLLAIAIAGLLVTTAFRATIAHADARVVESWIASWISAPDAPAAGYGVYHFRRTFDLASKPSSFVVHVSADNRYELYANGTRVAAGPARGDMAHWRYETIDLAPFLVPGKNVLAAVVWNYAEFAPAAQVTNATAFLVQADGTAERVADTNANWKAVRDDAYQALPIKPEEILYQYFVAGPGDRIDGARYPWGWERPEFDDAAWMAARVGGAAGPRGGPDEAAPWMLVPREIPTMEEHPERLARVRQSSGVDVPAAFPHDRAPFEVPARTKARLLLDQTYLTTAYPEIVVSGGKGATVSMRYAESLFKPGTMNKGNRDEIEGKELRGLRDVFVTDGGRERRFRPLWWRAYRYVELSVETADEPLTIEDVSARFTAYPFERKARFDAGSPELDRILDVGWRTARLCAHETYMDCPYYEQLQYVGDTRVQALVSLYMTGDDRLMRNAIELVDDSRTSEGLTYSRAPTRIPQYIPPFSLWWIGMVHDYWWYRDDSNFVRRMLPGVRAILTFFAAHQRASGSLGRVPFWNYVDWTGPWRGGVPPGPNLSPTWSAQGASPVDPDNASSLVDLQLLLAYTWAADLEASLGMKEIGERDRQAAEQLRSTIRSLYWDATRQLVADTPAKTEFSQQANALAILAGVVEGDEARGLMDRILADRSLVPCSVYFRHYLHSALNKTGEGDRYLDQLELWRTMLADGLTTWEETTGGSRSDCHAWGSSPNFELFRTVLGIDSAAPGFARVVIRPFLGKLTRVSGSIPHPKGEIAVSLTLEANGKLTAEVALPEGVAGDFVWHGTSHPLAPGRSKLTL